MKITSTMKKVAITGASGFIGREVVKQLENTKGVVTSVLDRNTHSLEDSESLKSFVEDKDVIIHLAGVNRGTNSELLQVNTLGMLSLLDAVLKYSPTARVVFASTFQVYLHQSLYGLSKKFAEELMQQYGLNHRISGTVLRLSNVYGLGGKPFYNSVVATFAHQIKQGESLNIKGDGSAERDYVYVDDVADAFVKAALYDQKNQTEVVDICSGESTSLNQVLDIIRNVCDKKFEVIYNDAVQDKPWPTKDKNFKKAKELFGWEPKTSLKDGLFRVVAEQ